MITNEMIEGLIANGNKTGKRIEYPHSGNLFILHNTNNRIAFACSYCINGKYKKKVVGYYGLIKAEEAIKIVDKVTLLALSGVDYFEEEAKIKKSKVTLGDFIKTTYMGEMKNKNLSPATIKNKKHIHNNLSSTLLDKPIADITKEDIKPILDKLIKNDKKATAKQWFLELRTIFKVAVFEDILSVNPVDKIRQPNVDNNTEVRLLEIHKKFHNEICKIKNIEDLQRKVIILLLAHLGIRIGELINMKWSDIDLENKILNNYQIKTNSINKIPLTDEVLELLDIAKKDNNTEYVCILNGRKMIDDTVSRILKKNNIDFTAHDFRRSFSTMANNSGVFLPISIEMCLGHEVRKGAEANYTIKQDYIDRKKVIFEWYSKLLGGIHGDN